MASDFPLVKHNIFNRKVLLNRIGLYALFLLKIYFERFMERTFIFWFIPQIATTAIGPPILGQVETSSPPPPDLSLRTYYAPDKLVDPGNKKTKDPSPYPANILVGRGNSLSEQSYSQIIRNVGSSP